MNKTSIIIYVQDRNNLASCLWSIQTFTAKNSYDISLVSEIPIDNVDTNGANVYMADGNAINAVNQAINDSDGEHIVFCMMML